MRSRGVIMRPPCCPPSFPAAPVRRCLRWWPCRRHRGTIMRFLCRRRPNSAVLSKRRRRWRLCSRGHIMRSGGAPGVLCGIDKFAVFLFHWNVDISFLRVAVGQIEGPHDFVSAIRQPRLACVPSSESRVRTFSYYRSVPAGRSPPPAS